MTNSTIDEPVTTWVEPELQPGADVPPAPSCSSCSRPATGIDPDTSNPICDACWEGIETNTATDLHTPELEPLDDTAAQIAKVTERAAALLATRIAALPPDQQAWMLEHPELATTVPTDRWTRDAIYKCALHISSTTDTDAIRHIITFETHRSDVERRDDLIDTAVHRITQLEHKPTPTRPWGTYDSVKEDRLIRTIRALTDLAKLDAAENYERHTYTNPERHNIIAAYLERRAELLAS